VEEYGAEGQKFESRDRIFFLTEVKGRFDMQDWNEMDIFRVCCLF